MRYTNEQLTIAQNTDKYSRVIALAGAGKTSTVALIVKEKLSQNPNLRILILTFTVSAKEAIKTRLALESIFGIEVETIHKKSLTEFRNYCNRAGVAKKELPKIVSKEAIIRFMAKSGKIGEDLSNTEIDQIAKTHIAIWNQELMSVPERNKLEISQAAKIANQIIPFSREKNLMDFDQILAMAIATQEKKTRRGTKYDLVIVDEAQDCTKLQRDFILGLKPKALTLVLDPNQSIFSFAGVGFHENLWAGIPFTDYSLTENFRCAQAIVDEVNLISPGLDMKTSLSGGAVNFVRVQDQNDQLQKLTQNFQPGDAVLARTNSAYQAFLNQLGINDYATNEKNRVLDSGVTISFGSLHWAKGQEWERVHLLDCSDKGFISADGDETEEKNLYYVGLTRAEKEIFIYHFKDKKPYR